MVSSACNRQLITRLFAPEGTSRELNTLEWSVWSVVVRMVSSWDALFGFVLAIAANGLAAATNSLMLICEAAGQVSRTNTGNELSASFPV